MEATTQQPPPNYLLPTKQSQNIVLHHEKLSISTKLSIIVHLQRTPGPLDSPYFYYKWIELLERSLTLLGFSSLLPQSYEPVSQEQDDIVYSFLNENIRIPEFYMPMRSNTKGVLSALQSFVKQYITIPYLLRNLKDLTIKENEQKSFDMKDVYFFINQFHAIVDLINASKEKTHEDLESYGIIEMFLDRCDDSEPYDEFLSYCKDTNNIVIGDDICGTHRAQNELYLFAALKISFIRFCRDRSLGLLPLTPFEVTLNPESIANELRKAYKSVCLQQQALPISHFSAQVNKNVSRSLSPSEFPPISNRKLTRSSSPLPSYLSNSRNINQSPPPLTAETVAEAIATTTETQHMFENQITNKIEHNTNSSEPVETLPNKSHTELGQIKQKIEKHQNSNDSQEMQKQKESESELESSLKLTKEVELKDTQISIGQTTVTATLSNETVPIAIVSPQTIVPDNSVQDPMSEQDVLNQINSKTSISPETDNAASPKKALRSRDGDGEHNIVTEEESPLKKPRVEEDEHVINKLEPLNDTQKESRPPLSIPKTSLPLSPLYSPDLLITPANNQKLSDLFAQTIPQKDLFSLINQHCSKTMAPTISSSPPPESGLFQRIPESPPVPPKSAQPSFHNPALTKYTDGTIRKHRLTSNNLPSSFRVSSSSSNHIISDSRAVRKPILYIPTSPSSSHSSNTDTNTQSNNLRDRIHINAINHYPHTNNSKVRRPCVHCGKDNHTSNVCFFKGKKQRR